MTFLLFCDALLQQLKITIDEDINYELIKYIVFQIPWVSIQCQKNSIKKIEDKEIGYLRNFYNQAKSIQ